MRAPTFGVSTMPAPPAPSPVELAITAALLALVYREPRDSSTHKPGVP
jgi:hypothetical protein